MKRVEGRERDEPAQHLVVTRRGRIHLRENRRDVAENRRVEKRTDEHHHAGEDLLVITVCRDVAEADARQRTHRVVQCGEIRRFPTRAVRFVRGDVAERVDAGELQFAIHLHQPTVFHLQRDER